MRKKKSSTATPFCKVCFKDIRPTSLHAILGKRPYLCHDCFVSLSPAYRHFKCDGVPFLSLYDYESGFQSLLFQFKGCFDIELAPIFLEYQLPLLKMRYRNHVVIPAPSSQSHNETRGFNHVVEVFSHLGLPLLPVLEKVGDRKQTDCNLEQRKEVGNYLRLGKKVSLRGKKALFVDDVYTTGSTAKACLKFIASLHPKSIEGLVLAKVIPK